MPVSWNASQEDSNIDEPGTTAVAVAGFNINM